MNILNLFRFSKDPTLQARPTSMLYVAKLYSASRFGGDYDFDTPMQADLISNHYVLLLKHRDKYYVVPKNEYEKAIEVSDINNVERPHELLVQPDSQKRFKPFTYYAPSAEYGYVTPMELRKLALFIHIYFVKGDSHANRRDLEIYYKFLKHKEMTDEEKQRLLNLKDFAENLSNEDFDLSK